MAKDIVDTKFTPLCGLFGRKEDLYQVPNYQRPYNWGLEELEALIDDLSGAFVHRGSERYFCGSLVLYKKDTDDRYDIIDGQQRLTTFVLLACVLEKLCESKIITLSEATLNKYIKESIYSAWGKETLTLATLDDKIIQFKVGVVKELDFTNMATQKNRLNNKYLENAHHLKDLLESVCQSHDFDNKKLNGFIDFIYEKVVFSLVICDNLESAIKVFTTLNARGMPLSFTDIVKAELMGKSKEDKDKRGFQMAWDRLGESLKKFNKKETKDSSGAFELFLTTYLYYLKGSKPEVALSKGLLQEWLDKNGNLRKSILIIMRDLEDFAVSYKEILENEKDVHIALLKHLKHKVYYRSILCTAHCVKYEHIESLKRLLVQYYYQNLLKGRRADAIRETSFAIIKDVKEKKTLEEVKKKIRQNLGIQGDNAKEILELLKVSNFAKRPFSKYILLLI
ncbi:DUF262 domain-containing protein [Helicobacter cetorum]|uniref:DUF262 domain-containing protein n=1 Tax=Helicobacter cetorum TaxID=138563 RepID=UPI000CF05248|nr:DUF262 domain-containing protein [Helicobacter cetorum]